MGINQWTKRVVFFAFLLCNLMTMTSSQALAAESTGGKVVRVGYVNVASYEEGGEGEYKTGSGYEYLQKISYFTGWRYEYVYGSFKELYNKLIDGEIDLFGDLSYTDERAKLFQFASYPQGKDVYFLYTSKNRTDLLDGDRSHVNGLTIGVTKDSYQEQLLKDWLVENQLAASIEEYDGYESSMEALDDGAIDAIATPKLANSTYDYAVMFDIGFSDYYFAVSNKRPDLLQELNEALYQIQSGNPNYNENLQSKYQSDMLSDTFINEKERQWLEKHNNTIRMGYLLNNLPYSDVRDDGELMGVLGTLAETLEYSCGISTQALPFQNYTEMYEALEQGEIDVMGPCYSDYWLAEQHNLIQTNTMISSTPILLYEKGTDMISTKVIAVSDESFIVPDAVRIMFPEAEIVVYDTIEDCLNAVAERKADCAVAAASQMSLLKRYRAARELPMAELPMQLDICLCTGKGVPELANLINKGITISGKLLSGAVLTQNSTVSVRYSLKDYMADNMTLLMTVVLLIIVALLAAVVYMFRTSRRLRIANQTVVQKQKELQTALSAAERANRAKTIFLANMSHDIRTPINGIMGMLGIIRNNQNNPSKIQDCLNKIRSSSEHLLQLLNDVLDLSRLESGQVVLEHVPFNLHKVEEDALMVVEEQAKEAGLKMVSEHMDASNVWLIGSPLHLKQIMLNLYTNAIKYNKPGGTIYTSLQEYDRADNVLTLKLVVEDTGIGMSQEFIDKELFAAFVQGENGARTKFVGSGLGMSIVQRIVEAMHGKITVESQMDRGTRFTILLPFEIDHSVHVEKTEPEKIQADIRGARVLLAEDNALNMEIAEFMLEKAGAVITKASDGWEAVKAFETSPEGSFDVILMDIMMPVMNGFDATQAIRAMKRSDAKTVAIFSMTANAFSEDARKSFEAGMNEHVAKPLNEKKLITLIAKYREQKRREDKD